MSDIKKSYKLQISIFTCKNIHFKYINFLSYKQLNLITKINKTYFLIFLMITLII